MAVQRLPGYTPRRDGGLSGYERVLARAGLEPVAGIDEAGRGACAGPLVVAAVTSYSRTRGSELGRPAAGGGSHEPTPLNTTMSPGSIGRK